MKFANHLSEFLGDSVGEAEVRDIARTAVANSIRSLKLAIGERLWLAREASRLGQQPASALHMGEARSLREQYEAATGEYRALEAASEVAGRPSNTVDGTES